MILTALRNMTVSTEWLFAVDRSDHQSCRSLGAFKRLRHYRVSGVFRGEAITEAAIPGIKRASFANASEGTLLARYGECFFRHCERKRSNPFFFLRLDGLLRRYRSSQ